MRIFRRKCPIQFSDNLFLLVGEVAELTDIFALDAADGATVSSDEILNLPHIEQIFGDGCLSEFLCYVHIYEYLYEE